MSASCGWGMVYRRGTFHERTDALRALRSAQRLLRALLPAMRTESAWSGRRQRRTKPERAGADVDAESADQRTWQPAAGRTRTGPPDLEPDDARRTGRLSAGLDAGR